MMMKPDIDSFIKIYIIKIKQIRLNDDGLKITNLIKEIQDNE